MKRAINFQGPPAAPDAEVWRCRGPAAPALRCGVCAAWHRLLLCWGRLQAPWAGPARALRQPGLYPEHLQLHLPAGHPSEPRHRAESSGLLQSVRTDSPASPSCREPVQHYPQPCPLTGCVLEDSGLTTVCGQRCLQHCAHLTFPVPSSALLPAQLPCWLQTGPLCASIVRLWRCLPA